MGKVVSLCFDSSTREDRTELGGVISVSLPRSANQNVLVAVLRRNIHLVSAWKRRVVFKWPAYVCWASPSLSAWSIDKDQ